MSTRIARAVLASFLALGACGGDDKDESPSATDAASLPMQTTFGGDRPTELLVPQSYDGTAALPLIVVLHGHSVTGAIQLAYTRIANLVDDENVLVLAPDGLVNEEGNPFWNATESCCDFYDSKVDDSAYLRGLIDDVAGVYQVDPKRIFLWGHSNGGFMSYRMACDHADVIAGIISLAGATHLSPASCSPSEPVNILQIHGDLDSTILYDGGVICAGPDCGYPGAEASVAQWATANGCGATRTIQPDRLDVDSGIDGPETRLESHDGCPAGGATDLWVIEGGGHIPTLRGNFDETVWSWFQDHPKP